MMHSRHTFKSSPPTTRFQRGEVVCDPRVAKLTNNGIVSQFDMKRKLVPTAYETCKSLLCVHLSLRPDSWPDGLREAHCLHVLRGTGTTVEEIKIAKKCQIFRASHVKIWSRRVADHHPKYREFASTLLERSDSLYPSLDLFFHQRGREMAALCERRLRLPQVAG